MRYPDVQVAIDDAALAARMRGPLGDRVRMCPVAFDPATEDAVAALAEQEVDLPGGGRLRIQPTSALVAIDIDAGGAVDARQGKVWRIWRPIVRHFRSSPGRSGCATCQAPSWSILPACRRAGARHSGQNCSRHYRMTRCTRGCLASPCLAWPRSSIARAFSVARAIGRFSRRWTSRAAARRRGTVAAAGIAGRTGGCRRTRGGRRGAGGSCTSRRTFLDFARGPRLGRDGMADRD